MPFAVFYHYVEDYPHKIFLKNRIRYGTFDRFPQINENDDRSPREIASLRGQLVSFVPLVEVGRGSGGGAFYFYFNLDDGLTLREGVGCASGSLQDPIKNIIKSPT